MPYRFIFIIFIFSITSTFSTKVDAGKGLENLCIYIVHNDKNRFRKMLKKERLNVKHLYTDVTCNGKSLLQFAFEKEANDVGQFLVKKIKASQLRKTTILDWANDNGFADSPITAAIIKRIN